MDETTANYRMRLAAIRTLPDPIGNGLLREVIEATLRGLEGSAIAKQGGIVLGYLLLELLERRQAGEAEARAAIGEVLERMAAAGKIGPASEAP